MIEEFLLLRAKSGDKQALEKLIQKYYDSILKYCYHHTLDKELALDLCQDTFVSFIDHLYEYDHRQKLSNFLYVIAGNKCKDYFKKKKPVLVEDIQEDSLIGDNFEENVDDRIDIELLLNSLDDELREIIILRYFQELKFGDIAKVIGTSESNVKYKCKKALDQLQELSKTISIGDIKERRKA